MTGRSLGRQEEGRILGRAKNRRKSMEVFNIIVVFLLILLDYIAATQGLVERKSKYVDRDPTMKKTLSMPNCFYMMLLFR